MNKVFLTTSHNVSGKKVIKEIGLLTGSSVHARSFLHDIWSRVLGFFGGEITTYTTLSNRTTKEAMENLLVQAEKK